MFEFDQNKLAKSIKICGSRMGLQFLIKSNVCANKVKPQNAV
jgi:hypothetical protein